MPTLNQSAFVATAGKPERDGDAQLAVLARALIDQYGAIQLNGNDLPTTLANLIASTGGAAALAAAVTGSDLTASGTLTTLATNIGAHDTQGVTLVSALLATTGALTSRTLVTPVLGVATGTSLAVTGLLKSSGTAGVGYATGAGGAVTQGTSRATGVTLSKTCGQITTHNASLAAAAFADFIVTNTLVAATDVIVANITPGGTGSPRVAVVNVAAGAYTLRVTNDHASTADTSADVINVAVIKAVAA